MPYLGLLSASSSTAACVQVCRHQQGQVQKQHAAGVHDAGGGLGLQQVICSMAGAPQPPAAGVCWMAHATAGEALPVAGTQAACVPSSQQAVTMQQAGPLPLPPPLVFY